MSRKKNCKHDGPKKTTIQMKSIETVYCLLCCKILKRRKLS